MSHAVIKPNNDHNPSGRFDSRKNVKRKSSFSCKNKSTKKQKSAVVMPTLDANQTLSEVISLEDDSNDVQDSVINMFTTARSLLKRPLDYSTLSEVHTRCKIIMKTLENTIESLTDETGTNFLHPVDSVQQGLYSSDIGVGCCKTSKHTVEGNELGSTNSFESELVPKKKRKRNKVSDSGNNIEIDSNGKKQSNIKISSQKTNVNSSTPGELLHTLFSPLTASNTWELLQLKRMLKDPFLSSSRKQCLNTRILELNENIIAELIAQAEQSKNNEVFVLEKLCAMAADSSLSPDQKEQVDCILFAFRDKVVRDITNSVIDLNEDYEVTIERLNAIIKVPCISDTDKVDFVSKLVDLRSKLSNDIIKQSNSSVEDATKILEKIRNLVDDPLLSDRARARLLSYVGFVRNKSIQDLTCQPLDESEDNEELIKKMGSLLQDPNIPYSQRLKVVEKLQICESTVLFNLKQSKNELKESLMSSANDILGFEGTNLDFIFGYSVETPPFVRCINVWNPKES